MKTINQLRCVCTKWDEYDEAKNNLSLLVRRSVDNANNELNARINDLRHLMNDQLIQLKHGQYYKYSFLDPILLKAI